MMAAEYPTPATHVTMTSSVNDRVVLVMLTTFVLHCITIFK